MFSNNKAFHSSNLYEENLLRSSKNYISQTQLPPSKPSISSQTKVRKNDNSFGVLYTDPGYLEETEKYNKIRGIPSSNPLGNPTKDLNKMMEFIKPTDNPAFYLKEYFFL